LRGFFEAVRRRLRQKSIAADAVACLPAGIAYTVANSKLRRHTMVLNRLVLTIPAIFGEGKFS